MKRWPMPLRLLAALLVLFQAPSGLAQDERILNYHSDIQIEADGSMTVSEQITVRSNQNQIRRGIFRDFPTRYRNRQGNRVIVDFEVIEVLRDGQPEPWFTERVANAVRLNTGNDDFLPGPGTYTYTIRYRTNRQLGFFEHHDELYWNATGLGWAFPVDQASARVHLPEAVDPEHMTLHHYTGPAGSRSSEAVGRVIGPGIAEFLVDQPLPPGHGLTVVVEFPKGLVTEPTPQDELGWFLRDNRGMLVLLIGSFAIIAFYLREWLTKGRGPAPGVIIARYEPPEGYSPAGLRYLFKERYDQGCFTADLVALAVKGKLAIDYEKKTFSESWTLRQTGQRQTGELPSSQSALFDALFEQGPVVALDSKNSSHLQGVMQRHTTVVAKRFKDTYIKTNAKTGWIGMLASLALTVLAFVLAGGPSAPLVITVIVLMLINFGFLMIMPAPTEKGRKLLDHVEGLKLYLSVAEKQDLARLQHPTADEPSLTPERFEQLLPLALALEVEEAWTDKFTTAVGQAMAEKTRSSLAWYSGTGASLASLGGLSKSLSQNLSSSIASAASPPGSSAGGGGFSGGGGGGGGGGGR